MRVVLQRVAKAAVAVGGEEVSSIGKGLLILVGITENDADKEIDYLVNKIICLRIFDDDMGVMNLSLEDVAGDVLIVSQFTLMARTKKGNRPSYIDAAKREISEPLYEKFCDQMQKAIGREVKRGVFGANMQVSLVNSGPVTIIMDTESLLMK